MLCIHASHACPRVSLSAIQCNAPHNVYTTQLVVIFDQHEKQGRKNHGDETTAALFASVHEVGPGYVKESELFRRVMKKREEGDDQQRCDRVQTTVGSLACAGSTGNCGCDRTSPPHLRYGNTRRPFAARMTHAQISLRLVVVKRNRRIEQEAQHGPLA
jgi:hypothetical protein